MLEFFRKNHIGVDFFYNQLRAVDYKEGIIYDESLLSFFEQIPHKYQLENVKTEIADYKYLYNADSVEYLFKQFIKQLNSKAVKPAIYIAIPSEIKHCDFGNMWSKNIEQVLLKSNIDSLTLIESLICAAHSINIQFCSHKYNGLYSKYIFIHQTSKATIACILFYGKVFNTKIIYKEPDRITAQEITNLLKDVLNDKNFTPNILNDKNLEENERETLNKSWKKNFEKDIYLVAPIETCNQFESYIDDYKLNCSENYDNCIINGLEKILINVNEAI